MAMTELLQCCPRVPSGISIDTRPGKLLLKELPRVCTTCGRAKASGAWPWVILSISEYRLQTNDETIQALCTIPFAGRDLSW